MTHVRITTTAAVAAIVAVPALLGAPALAPADAKANARAGAKATCSPIPKNPLVPHILSPCNGARLAPATAVTFKVYDGDTQAGATPPLILISSSRKLSDGHLAAPPPLGGDFHSLTSEAAAPTEFSYTSPAHGFPKWWENTAGTYYVQIRQTDTRAGASGRFYSPITEIDIK